MKDSTSQRPAVRVDVGNGVDVKVGDRVDVEVGENGVDVNLNPANKNVPDAAPKGG